MRRRPQPPRPFCRASPLPKNRSTTTARRHRRGRARRSAPATPCASASSARAAWARDTCSPPRTTRDMPARCCRRTPRQLRGFHHRTQWADRYNRRGIDPGMPDRRNGRIPRRRPARGRRCRIRPAGIRQCERWRSYRCQTSRGNCPCAAAPDRTRSRVLNPRTDWTKSLGRRSNTAPRPSSRPPRCSNSCTRYPLPNRRRCQSVVPTWDHRGPQAFRSS